MNQELRISCRELSLLKHVAFSLFFICSFLILFQSVSAASVKITQFSSQVSEGDEFQIDVTLASKDKEINALEGVLHFSENILAISRITEKGSVVNFWVHNPNDKKGQTSSSVTFSGVIPGGYAGEGGKLFSIVFKAQKKGTAKITLDKVFAFENNGLGNNVGLTAQGISLVVVRSLKKQQSVVDDRLSLDKVPPELFEPQIGQDKSLFEGKQFLVFVAVDKGSGIDYYEVSEGRSDTPAGDSFTLATSPYVLKDQSGEGTIFVRAIDFAGNSRLIKVDRHFSTNFGVLGYLRGWIWIILVSGILFVLVTAIKRKKCSVL